MAKGMSGVSQRLGRDVVKDIEKIKERLEKEGVVYKAIYLFGSHARGRATARSDIDLCIVVSTRLFNANDNIESEIRVAVNKLLYNTDVIVVSERDFKNNRLSPILHEIRKNSICVA